MQSTILVILPPSAVFSSISLPPQILPISTSGISKNGKQDVLKQPEANTYLLYFSAGSYYKSSVEKISLYLISHFCIRIIVLTCPGINKSARNHQPTCKITQIIMMRGQYYFNSNLRSLSVCSCPCEDSRVPPINLY